MSACVDAEEVAAEVDIEDVIGAFDLGPDERSSARQQVVVPRVRRRPKISLSPSPSRPASSEQQPPSPKHQQEEEQDAAPSVPRSIIPGTQRIFIKTWGCAHNSSDGEYMAGLLAAQGYVLTAAPADADLWLLNSCTVKGPAEDHFRNEVVKARQLDKPVVVAGCVPQGQPHSGYLKGLSVLGVQQIDRVVEVVEQALLGNSVRLLGGRARANGAGPSLHLPKVRRNPLVEIVPINVGCLNACTYCKTKHARGQLASYPVADIVARVKTAFAEGVVEVWMTSEDTGAYGRDLGTSLPALLRQVVACVPAHGMLRLGMTNPPYILEHLTAMAEILRHPRVYSFLHVPVQSGSDAVLGDMRREYTVAQFRQVVDTLREGVPDLTVATDVIAGFPSETEADFEATLQLCTEYRFPSLFMNQFFARPGTPAARMHRLATPAQVKARTRRLDALFHSYRTYDHRLGARQTVLVTDTAADGLHLVGHNKSYEQVLLPLDPRLMGKMVEVDIFECGKHFIRGRLVHTPSSWGALREQLPQWCGKRGLSVDSCLVGCLVVLFALLLCRSAQLVLQ